MAEFLIETERLILREWRQDDAEAMYPSGQDARVMAFLGPLMDLDACRWLVDGQILNQSLFGHCFWPIERRSDGALLGFCGLNPGPQNTPMEGKIEIGWRLTHGAWGQGYAREAAAACINWAWENLSDDAVWSFTVPANTRSRRLMERLGMTRRTEFDFDHPALAVDDPLQAHITYSISRPLLAR
jgi:RimJ/RimL family protein N-acetyltransferase